MAAPLHKRIPSQIAASALEGLLGGLGSATEGVLGLANTGINAVRGKNAQGNILPSRLPLLNLEEARNVTQDIFGKENLQAGSFPEEILQSVGRNLIPTIATGGSNIPLALGRDVAGTAVQKGLEKIGAPKILQIFGGIAGEKGLNKVLQKVGKSKAPQYLSEMAQEAKSNFYNQVEKTGEKVVTDAKNYKNKLQDIGEQISKDTRLTLEGKKKLYRDINQYQGDFNKGKITGKDLFDRRTQLNEIIGNSSGREKFYYQGIKNSLVDELGKQSNLHPKFGKYLSDADAIHSAQNFGSVFKDALVEYPAIKKQLSNPYAYGAATLGTKLFLSKDPVSALTTAAIGTGAVKTAQKATQILGFLREEAPRKILLEASENVIKRNFPAAARSYNKLNQLADKYEKGQKKSEGKQNKQISKSRAGLVERL